VPSVNEAQRKLAGIALSIKRGETTKGYSKQAAEMARSMSVKELRAFASKPIKKR